jgi:AraC family transcriptional regulator
MKPVDSRSLVDGQAYLHHEMYAEELRVTHKSYTNTFTQGWHEHEEASIDLVLRGGGVGNYGGREIHASPGVVAFFGRQLRHRFTAGSEGIQSMHMVIPESVFEEHRGLGEIAVSELDHTRAIGLAVQLFRELEVPDSSSALCMDSLCHELFGEVCGAIVNRDRGAGWLREAVEILQCSPDTPLSLGWLAGTVGVSRGHFARAFRSAMGCTPGAYHRAVRVSHAARILAGGESIARASQKTGFADQAHLTRVFSAHIGLTPARFQRSLPRF